MVIKLGSVLSYSFRVWYVFCLGTYWTTKKGTTLEGLGKLLVSPYSNPLHTLSDAQIMAHDTIAGCGVHLRGMLLTSVVARAIALS